ELYKEKRLILKLKRQFGNKIITNGKINKKELGKIVFEDKEKLSSLNKIVHGIVKQKIKAIKHKGKLVFVEVPLLFEAKMESLFDKTILVIAPKKACLKRLLKKGIKKREFEKRVSFQINKEKAKKKADYIINNNSTTRNFLVKAIKVYEKIRRSL
ncbi:MAG: dephospho-CoA kinase, partial [Candidatus Diapherotrites archaeon]